MRGEAFGLVNFVSRPFTAFSTILCEYTSSPLSFVFVLSLLSTQAIHHMREIETCEDQACPLQRNCESSKTKTTSYIPDTESDDFVKVQEEERDEKAKV